MTTRLALADALGASVRVGDARVLSDGEPVSAELAVGTSLA